MKDICQVKGCDKKATAIIRTKNVCRMHFRYFQEDNKKRIEYGIDIPKKLEFLDKKQNQKV